MTPLIYGIKGIRDDDKLTINMASTESMATIAQMPNARIKLFI